MFENVRAYILKCFNIQPDEYDWEAVPVIAGVAANDDQRMRHR
jgi:hypothetical protein